MVENHEAKLSTYGKLLFKKEKLSWEALKIALDVEELVRTMMGRSLVFMEQSKQ